MVGGGSSASTSDGTPSGDESNLSSSSGRVMVYRYQNKSSEGPRSINGASPSSPGNGLCKLTVPPQEVLLNNVFRDRLFALFLENNLSAASKDSVHIPFAQREDLMFQVINLPDMAPALESTLLAVYLARLGRQHDRPAIVHASLKLYTRGMSEMRRAILNKSSQASDQNLATCLALLMYEITECPGGTPDAYMAHFRGTMQMLKMRGAGAHTSGIAHSVFHMLRIHSVSHRLNLAKVTTRSNSDILPLCHQVLPDMVVERKSFLAEPEWRELPWSSATGSDSKAPFDHLVDILLDMPGLSRGRKTVEMMIDPQQILTNSRANIVDGQRLESKLDDWLEGYKSTVPGALYHPELSKIDSSVDSPEMGKLFPVAFRFPANIVGQSMIYYWVGLMSVQAHFCFTYTTISQLLSTLDSMGREKLPCTCDCGLDDQDLCCLQHFTMEMLPPLGHREDWPRTTAHHICQSAEYFLQDGLRGFVPARVLPALALVKGFLKYARGDWTREIGWIDEMFGRISASGNAVAGAIRIMG